MAGNIRTPMDFMNQRRRRQERDYADAVKIGDVPLTSLPETAPLPSSPISMPEEFMKKRRYDRYVATPLNEDTAPMAAEVPALVTTPGQASAVLPAPPDAPVLTEFEFSPSYDPSKVMTAEVPAPLTPSLGGMSLEQLQGLNRQAATPPTAGVRPATVEQGQAMFPAQPQLGMGDLRAMESAVPPTATPTLAAPAPTDPQEPWWKTALQTLGRGGQYVAGPDPQAVPVPGTFESQERFQRTEIQDQGAGIKKLEDLSPQARALLVGLVDQEVGRAQARLMNNPDDQVAQRVLAEGVQIVQGIEDITEFPEFTNLAGLPEWLATTGIRQLGAPLVATDNSFFGQTVGRVLGPVVGNWIKGAKVLGKFAPAIAKGVAKIAPAAGAAIANRPQESEREAASVYFSMKNQPGKTEADAKAAARKVFWGNMALLPVDVAQAYLALGPKSKTLREALGFGGKTFAKYAAGEVADLATAMATEGAEEVYQEGLAITAEGGDITQEGNRLKQAFAGGAIIGGGMHIGMRPFSGGEGESQTRRPATSLAPIDRQAALEAFGFDAEGAKELVQRSSEMTDDQFVQWVEGLARVRGLLGDSTTRTSTGPAPANVAGAEAGLGTPAVLPPSPEGQAVSEPVGIVSEPPVQEGDITPPQAPVAPTPTLDRAQVLRDANPGMDEKAIVDLVRTTGNLTDEEFTAFAQRMGRPAAPATQTPAQEATSPTPKAPATNEYAGRTFKHFTTLEGKAALESGADFDFGVNPQHGTGDFSDGPKAGRFAGNRLYLSLDDNRWGKVSRQDSQGEAVEATEANLSKGTPFYDYDTQKWMVRIGQVREEALQPVEYKLADDARILVIDSEEALKAATREASDLARRRLYPVSEDNAMWDTLARKYDAVALKNVAKVAQATDSKFFKAASGDQLIVLNPTKAQVVRPAQTSRPTKTPAEPKTFKGWNTPVNKGQEARASLQGVNLPDGMFVALDQPFESDVHNKKNARQVSVSVQNTFDPDGLLDPANRSMHGPVVQEFTSAVNEALRAGQIKDALGGIRTFYRDFLKSKGFDSYVRGIDGDPKNRELIVFDRKAVKVQASGSASAPPSSPARDAARAKFTTDNAFQNFLKDPNAWRVLLTKPQDPAGRYWIQARAEAAGVPFPQKVGDLLEEQASLLTMRPNKATQENLKRVRADFEKAIGHLVKPSDPTFLERLLKGETPISLTGKKAPPGALEGRVQSTATEGSELNTPGSASAKAQQGSLFNDASLNLTAEQREQLVAYRAELSETQKGLAETRAKWETEVEKLSKDLAADATKLNNELRTEFFKQIKDRGYIRPYAKGYLKEDLLSRVPKQLIRRNGAMNLDKMADALGYESGEALVNEIEKMNRVRAVEPSRHRSEAEDYVGFAKPDPKAMLDYYVAAERNVLEAIEELEGIGRAKESQTGAARPVEDQEAVASGGGSEVQGDRGGDRAPGSGRGKAGAEGEAPLGRAGSNQEMSASAAVPDYTRKGQPATGVQRADILKTISKLLGVPIHQGRYPFALRGARGVYKGFERVIRTKRAEDLPTIQHEVGHHLDALYGLSKSGDFDAELFRLTEALYGDEVKDATADYKRREGVAEFSRAWFVNPEKAQSIAGRFYAAFDAAVSADQEFGPAIRQIQQVFLNYYAQNPVQRAMAAISWGPTKNPLTWERLRNAVREGYRRFYAGQIDELDPLRANKETFERAWQSRGWQGVAQVFMERGQVAPDRTVTGPSLQRILVPVTRTKQQTKEFGTYAVARRVLYLNETRGWGDDRLPMTVEEAKAVVDAFGSPSFQKAFDELQTWQDAVLRYYAESGMLSAKQVKNIREANRVYVPFRRLAIDEGVGGGGQAGSGKKMANLGQGVKRMKGGTGTVINPLESMVRNTFAMVHLAERNAPAVTFANWADSTEGIGYLVEQVPADQQAIRLSTQELAKTLKQVGIDEEAIEEAMEYMKKMERLRYLEAKAAKNELTDKQVTELDELTMWAEEDADAPELDLSQKVWLYRAYMYPNANAAREGIIMVWRNGEPTMYQVKDPLLYRGLLMLDSESANMAVKVLRSVASTLRAFATTTVEFMGRNVNRDAIATSVYGRGMPFEAHLRGIADLMGGKKWADEWMASGGGHSAMVSIDRNYAQESLHKVLAHRTAGLRRFLRSPVSLLRDLSETLDRAPRIGEFQMARTGRSKWVLPFIKESPVSRQAAALESRDVTLDFNRAGPWGRTYNQIAAFFNAGVQDIDKFRRFFLTRETTAEQKAAGLIKAGLFITLPTILLRLINKDDEDYQKLPQWRKDLFWNVPVGDGHFVPIPIPHLLGLVFKVVPERMAIWAETKDPKEAWKGFGTTAAAVAVPNFLPTALALMAELWGNRSLQTGASIVPRSEEQFEKELQFGAGTSEVAKAAGRLLGQSPRKIEHTVRGTLGGMGAYGMDVADWLLESAGVVEPPPPARLETPIISRIERAFYVDADAGGSAMLEEFYDRLGQAETLWRSLPRRAEVYKPLGERDKWTAEERRRYAEVLNQATPEERRLLAETEALRKASRALSDLRKQQKQIEMSRTMPTSAKEQAIKRLRERMDTTAQKALKK